MGVAELAVTKVEALHRLPSEGTTTPDTFACFARHEKGRPSRKYGTEISTRKIATEKLAKQASYQYVYCRKRRIFLSDVD